LARAALRDTPAQTRRRRKPQLRGGHGFLHFPIAGKLRGTARASMQVFLHVASMSRVQLAIEDGMDEEF
jgi:hypothetical protein